MNSAIEGGLGDAMDSGKKNLRFTFALAAGKLAAAGLRLLHRAGGQVPGVIAGGICPDFLGRIDKPEQLIFVTGTNGKTTVSNMLDDLLIGVGRNPLTNRAGGNVDAGIISALLKAASMSGKQSNDLAVFELDELSTRRVLPYVDPTILLVTNLYRDSFMRNANPDYISSVISASVSADTKLVLNGDDLISSRIAPDNTNRVYYSVARLPEDLDAPEGIVNDLTACPECGGALEYEYCHMRHIGKLHCTKCGLTNPAPDYEAVQVDRDADTVVIREHCHGGIEHTYKLVSASITEVYNLVACVAVMREMGIEAADIAAALEKGISVTESRHSEQEVGGIRLINAASKGENSTATSIFFSLMRREPGRKALLLIIDDMPLEKNPYGSEYTGWHYQADFENLADPSVVQIVYYGPRGNDAKLRMLLAGVDEDKIVLANTFEDAANQVTLDNVDAIYCAFDVYRSADADLCRKLVRARIEGRS